MLLVSQVLMKLVVITGISEALLSPLVIAFLPLVMTGAAALRYLLNALDLRTFFILADHKT